MSDSSKDMIEFDLAKTGETPRAILMSDGITSAWIPKSQIEDGEAEDLGNGLFRIVIPEWLAIDKGLV